MGAWLTWTSTGGYLPTWWREQGEGRGHDLIASSRLQGLRVHRHQCGLAMRQDRGKLHSAGRPARPIR